MGRFRRWRNDRYRRRRGYDDSTGTWRKVAAASVALVAAGACGSGSGSRFGEVTRVAAGPPPVRWRLASEVVPTTQPPAPSAPTVTRSEPSGRARVPTTRPRSAPTGDPWGCIRKYESGGTTDPAGSNDSRDGYYQIIPSTWANEKGGYRASDGKLYPTAQSAPYDIQTERAHTIQSKAGWGQWSTAHRCGLA